MLWQARCSSIYIRIQPLKLQGRGQSGFTPGRSTADHILAFLVLEERWSDTECLPPISIPRKQCIGAFSASVHREHFGIYNSMGLLQGPLVCWMTSSYSGTENDLYQTPSENRDRLRPVIWLRHKLWRGRCKRPIGSIGRISCYGTHVENPKLMSGFLGTYRSVSNYALQ